MSLSINPIQTVKVVDPVLDFSEKQFYAVLVGGKRTTWKPIISTSYSNGSAIFSAPPPSPSIAVSRNIKFFQPVTIQFSGNAPDGQTLLQSGFDAFRAFPLSTNISTLQLDLNNTSFTINMSDTIQALLRYHNPDNLKNGSMSLTPSTLDKSQQFSDLQGSILNPLNSVVDTIAGSLDPRGAFPYTNLVNNVSEGIETTTTATVSANLVEDIFLSPLLFGTNEKENGFIGLQTMQLTVNWLPDLSRMWCHDNSGGTLLTDITITLGQPILLMEYKTPSQLQPIPSFRQYPYYEVQRYPTDSGETFVTGETKIVSSSNIQLNSIPRIMYIYARKRNQDLTYTDTDTYFSIEQISINWANNSGLLSNARKYDLFEMSQKNGCCMNWREWSGEDSYFLSGSTEEKINGPGSVLAVEFGTDLALNSDEAAGVNGTYQLQIEIQITNRSAESVIPSLYIVVVNEGVFTLQNNSAYSQIGVISRSDVLKAQKTRGVSYDSLKYMSGAGNSWFKNFARKLKNTIRTISKHSVPVIKEGIKTYKTYAPIIKEIMALTGVGKKEAEQMYMKHGASLVHDLRGGQLTSKRGKYSNIDNFY